MTGYGSAALVTSEGSYLLEIHAVNRKNLDMSIFVPRDLLALDALLRKWIGSCVQRGQVTLKLTKDVKTHEAAIPESALLSSFKQEWEEVACKLGYAKEDVTLSFLVAQLEHLPSKTCHIDLEKMTEALDTAFQKAIRAFLEMREQEGEQIAHEVTKSLDKIKSLMSSLGDYAQGVAEEYRQKLEAKFKEFTVTNDELKEKIAREVVLYVDRGDITEELGRLSAHIKSFEEKMRSHEAIGKLLDFMVIEMHREANTMGAKSQSLSVTTLALAIKSEVEKIREQIQNIE